MGLGNEGSRAENSLKVESTHSEPLDLRQYYSWQGVSLSKALEMVIYTLFPDSLMWWYQ